MKVSIKEVSGLALIGEALNQIRVGRSDSQVSHLVNDYIDKDGNNEVECRSTTKLGNLDKAFLAYGHYMSSPDMHRAMGLAHVCCIITATPSWFKRAGLSFYTISANGDGTMTAAVAISYYRLWGLYTDENLEGNEEWDEFFNEIADEVPYFDLFISEDSVEYDRFDAE